MTLQTDTSAFKRSFDKIHPAARLCICLIISVFSYFFIHINHIDVLTHLLISWEVFCMCLIIMEWITFSTTTIQQIRRQSSLQDSSRMVIFLIILVATLSSFLAILLLVVTKEKFKNQQDLHLIISVAGLILSWFLIHTIFTLRYAHIYYDDDERDPTTHAAGLSFPEDEAPDYMDFAYFSFVLGMTFQVSDVEIQSKKIRRLAMWHGMLSFGYNTIMIALTINMIAGFGG